MIEQFKIYLQDKLLVSDLRFDSFESMLISKSVKRGARLLNAGDTIPYGFFVMEGCLRNYMVKNDKEHIIQFAPENWWIGANNAVKHPKPSFLNIDAVEDSRIVLFDYKFIKSFGDSVSGFNDMIQDLQQNAFRSLERRIMHLLSSSADERYQYFISQYPALANRVPQKMIASFLGLTPQSLSRVRARFL